MLEFGNTEQIAEAKQDALRIKFIAQMNTCFETLCGLESYTAWEDGLYEHLNHIFRQKLTAAEKEL